MNKTKLFHLLSTFTSAERREFRRWLHSPYFNRREDICRLFDYWEECEVLGIEAEKEGAFRRVFGASDSLSEDHQIRLVMSYLLKQAEQFLVQQEMAHVTRLNPKNNLHRSIENEVFQNTFSKPF